MLVLYCVLSVIVAQSCTATPLYLEINRTDPETGDIITTKIELDDGLIGNRNLRTQEIDDSTSQTGYEMNLAESEYYYDCSMPIPPIIEKSLDSYDARQIPPTPSSESVFDSALAGFNSIGLNIFSLALNIYNVVRP